MCGLYANTASSYTRNVGIWRFCVQASSGILRYDDECKGKRNHRRDFTHLDVRFGSEDWAEGPTPISKVLTHSGLLAVFILRQSFTKLPRLALNLLCSPDRPWVCNSPASPSWISKITSRHYQDRNLKQFLILFLYLFIIIIIIHSVLFACAPACQKRAAKSHFR